MTSAVNSHPFYRFAARVSKNQEARRPGQACTTPSGFLRSLLPNAALSWPECLLVEPCDGAGLGTQMGQRQGYCAGMTSTRQMWEQNGKGTSTAHLTLMFTDSTCLPLLLVQRPPELKQASLTTHPTCFSTYHKLRAWKSKGIFVRAPLVPRT